MTSKHVLKSKTIGGALLGVASVLAPIALNRLGVTEPGDQQALIQVAGVLAGAALTTYGRATAKTALRL